MKRLFPIALLLCVLCTVSSFTPVQPHTFVIKKGAIPLSFPVTGTTPGKQGTLNYEVIGGGSTPYNIKYYYNGAQVGTSYPFTTYPGAGGVYTAGGTDMYNATGINGVEFTVYSSGTQYAIEFFSMF